MASGTSGVPVATATVVRTNLATTTQLYGTLGYADTYTVVAQQTQGMITALPRPGQVITRDQPVYEIDGVAVRLFYGRRPSWRPLHVGVAAGPDVRELEANLVALGYASLTPDDRFTGAIGAAVSRWQRATGQPATGEVDPGEVTFQPGPIRVTGIAASLGAPATLGTPVLSATSTTPVVTLDVPAAQTYLVHAGDAVTVTLPAGDATPGRVRSISSVAVQQADAGPTPAPRARSGQPTVPATITLANPTAVAGLDQAPVTVNITDRSVRGVLAVPVTALVALSGGGYGVYLHRGGARRLVPVMPGLFTDTLVEVKGGPLREGDAVEVPVG